MWKYVAFVLLVIFCVPAVLEDPSPNSTTTVGEAEETTTVITNSSSDTNSSDTTNIPVTSDEDSTVNGTNATAATTTNAPVTTSIAATTTDASVTTGTAATTTSSAPATTALPPPAVGKYAIQDHNNKTCLRVEMALRVDITDPMHVQYNFPLNASTDGSDCNSTDHTQILKLTDQHLGHSLTFIFAEENKKYCVQNITFSYSPLEVKTSGHYFCANEGRSYLCNAEAPIRMDNENVTLTFSSVHVQAYGAESFGLAEECDADDKVGEIVPIAVGCALGALVVIVLIAYLVGRRRSRQRGYQSV